MDARRAEILALKNQKVASDRCNYRSGAILLIGAQLAFFLGICP